MRSHASTVALSVAALMLAFALVPAPASAADRAFTLYGDQAAGWGFTNTTMSNPGPALSVDLGDNVTLTLNASDGAQHNWFIDYDGNGNPSPGEPSSPNFRDEQIVWNFTADVAGNYTYRCRFHGTTMTGNITISGPSNGTAPPSADALPYVLAGGLFAAVVFIALATVYMRRRKKSVPPPPET
jgi:plastocyanin